MTKLFLYVLSVIVSVALARYAGLASLLVVFVLCGLTFLFSTAPCANRLKLTTTTNTPERAEALSRPFEKVHDLIRAARSA